MTLTRIASGAGEDSEKRIRNQASARRAYDQVSRISHHATLTDNERQNVDDKFGGTQVSLGNPGRSFCLNYGNSHLEVKQLQESKYFKSSQKAREKGIGPLWRSVVTGRAPSRFSYGSCEM